jgi:hypothetical protein
MIHARGRGFKTIVLSVVFTAMMLGFFCCYLFKDVRFFIQVLILFFAWAGVGSAWITSRFKWPWRVLALMMIVAVYWEVPVGNRQSPALFYPRLRALAGKSYLYLNAREVFRSTRSDAPEGTHPVLVTAENLVLLDFYSPGLTLYPLSKNQEYARVPQIARMFPETIDELLKKAPVYTTDLDTNWGLEAEAFKQFKEDFQLVEVPCHLYGDSHLYRVIQRKQTIPRRRYWGG